MNSKKTFTTDRLEKIIASALNNRSINPSQSLPSQSLNFAKYPAYKLTAQKVSAPLKKYLPYSLNYKNFEKLVLVIALSLIFTAGLTPSALAAAGLRPTNPMGALTRLQARMQQTEAGAGAEVCTDCASRSPQSSLSNYLSQLPIVRDGFARVHNVAIFDQDGRQAIMDLRRRNPQTLTTEERAILRASAQTGTLTCSNVGTNATLIRLEDGRDAVITSAHSFVDESGQPKCDLTTVQYMPNVNFHMGGNFEPYTLTMVDTNGELPMNIENTRSGNFASPSRRKDDFLIFVLSENISNDSLPDGSTRGFMRIAASVPQNSVSYLISRTSNFRDGLTAGYESCPTANNGMELFHLCATNSASSSSAITHLIDGEMVLTGIHTRSQGLNTDRVLPTPSRVEGGNIGLSMDTVRRYLNDRSRPVIVTSGISI